MPDDRKPDVSASASAPAFLFEEDRAQNTPVRSASEMRDKVLSPLAEQWFRRIERAKKAKKRFNTVARYCRNFFSGDTGFLWEDDFRSEYLNGITKPTVTVSLAKAFELVALYGPSLFWRYPTRTIKRRRRVDVEEVAAQLGDLPGFDEAVREDAVAEVQGSFETKVAEDYLAWSAASQELQKEAELATTEALLTGRGVLWTNTYKYPDSDRTYTGSFYGSVDDLLVDPDCKDPTLRTAGYVIRRHEWPVWKLEKKLGFQRGTLREYATVQSEEAAVRQETDHGRQNNPDRIEWYEVWSKAGIGTRMRDVDAVVGAALDDAVGDHAYFILVKGYPGFLNATASECYSSSDKELKSLFKWRTAEYGDDATFMHATWPCRVLDFYPVPGSAWPLAPLAPGLGELICMNLLLTAYVETAWENRKQLIATMKSAGDEIKTALSSSKLCEVVEISEHAQKSINDMVQFLNRPIGNREILEALDRLSMAFDKRVGLSEIWYSMSSTQVRVAADVASKSETASIRPEKMGRDVAAWMSDVGNQELALALKHVGRQAVKPIVGAVGAILWEDMRRRVKPDELSVEMTCIVDARDMMRPNRAREAQILQNLSQYVLPTFTAYAQQTGDGQPLNGFIQSLGESMEKDLSDWSLEEWKPQEPDPQVQQMQQQMQQLEMQKTQSVIELNAARAEESRAAVGKTQARIQLEQQEFQWDTIKEEKELQLQEAEIANKIEVSQAEMLDGLLEEGVA